MIVSVCLCGFVCASVRALVGEFAPCWSCWTSPVPGQSWEENCWQEGVCGLSSRAMAPGSFRMFSIPFRLSLLGCQMKLDLSAVSSSALMTWGVAWELGQRWGRLDEVSVSRVELCCMLKSGCLGFGGVLR